MAAIEKRGESFRIVFWFQGRRFRRSLEGGINFRGFEPLAAKELTKCRQQCGILLQFRIVHFVFLEVAAQVMAVPRSA